MVRRWNNIVDTAGKFDLGLRFTLDGGLAKEVVPMEARVPIAPDFEEVWRFMFALFTNH